MWVYKIKTIDSKPKASLIVKGYPQKEAIDFQEVFSPMLNVSTLHLLFVLTNTLNLELFQMDI